MTATDQTLVLPAVLGANKNVLPYLAMGMIASYLREMKASGLLDYYRIGGLVPDGFAGRPLKNLYDRVSRANKLICLFSSYVWNHDLNLEVAGNVRAMSPDALIIFGGPHVPKYVGETEEFLRRNPCIDIAVLGEGEVACLEILLALAGLGRAGMARLSAVDGIVFSHNNEFTRTPSRKRVKDIAELPSPYLTGEFGPWFKGFEVTVLETNRGCPYGCTYCDWGSATLQKITKFPTSRVIAEIEFLAQREAQTIFIADANFGMLEEDITIAQALVDIKDRTGYPKRVETNFAKNGGRRLMEVIRILHQGGLLPTGIIALQTTDPAVLATIARDNIKTQSYEKMMAFFTEQNIPMASDLMIGLPGQTVDSFANDLQFCFNWKISATANYTSMMPNAPMAESSYRKQHHIVTDENNMIQSTATFTAADMDYMKKLYTSYMFHVRFSVLKYILYYLQVDHGVQAITLLRRWLDSALAADPQLPISVRVIQEIFKGSAHKDWALLSWGENADFLFENTEAYFAEFLSFSIREFGITLGESQYRTLLAAQQSVIPRAGRAYPYTVELEHDISAYIKQIRKTASVDEEKNPDLLPMSRFGPGTLTVVWDADTIESTVFKVFTTHADAWELSSPLRFY